MVQKNLSKRLAEMLIEIKSLKKSFKLIEKRAKGAFSDAITRNDNRKVDDIRKRLATK